MKSLFEQLGGTYRKEGDYDIPDLEMTDSENFEMDIYGHRHLYFLQHYRRVIYIDLLTSGNLNEYLTEIKKQAQKRFFRIVEQMKQKQGITEQLKVNNAMEWTAKVNCIKQQAEENILKEMIYN